jgi:hypothetical protein
MERRVLLFVSNDQPTQALFERVDLRLAHAVGVDVEARDPVQLRTNSRELSGRRVGAREELERPLVPQVDSTNVVELEQHEIRTDCIEQIRAREAQLLRCEARPGVELVIRPDAVVDALARRRSSHLECATSALLPEQYAQQADRIEVDLLGIAIVRERIGSGLGRDAGEWRPLPDAELGAVA